MTLQVDELRQAWDIVRANGGWSVAASRLGLSEQTLRGRVKRAIAVLNLPHPLTRSIDSKFFVTHAPADESRTIEELLAYKRQEAERATNAEDTAQLIRIDIKTPGPIGIFGVGDPHIDSHGCDLPLLERHLNLVRPRAESIFAVNIGDVHDNWIGRLARLYSGTTVSAKEKWKLVEWLITTIAWAVLIRGNHDHWSGDNDPLDWIARGAGIGADQLGGARIAFHHPNGAVTRLNARHDFRGNSQFNPLHALKKETLNGHRDHVLMAGHRHIGADAGDYIADLAFQMVRLSGYKTADSFRQEMGLHAKPLHPAALIIVDPEQPDESRARAWCAPTVEAGVEILDFLRERWIARNGA